MGVPTGPAPFYESSGDERMKKKLGDEMKRQKQNNKSKGFKIMSESAS